MRTRQIFARCLLMLILTTAVVARVHESATPPLPASVARLVNSDTIAVGRVDLQKLDLGNAMPLIAEWGRMPAADAAMSTAVAIGARQSILNAGGSELFLIVNIENFPRQALTVVLPLKSKSKEDAVLVKALFAGRDVDVVEQSHDADSASRLSQP